MASHPPDMSESDRKFRSKRFVLTLAIGLGAGIVLCAIIAMVTENLALGLGFGLLPGVTIGVVLGLTAPR